MNYYLRALLRYGDFSGRANRREFWTFVLLHAIFSTLLLVALWVAIFIMEYGSGESIFTMTMAVTVVLNVAYHAIMLVPSLAIAARRLHDRDIRAQVLFIILAPIVGPLVLGMLLLLPGTTQANRFGPVPTKDNSLPINCTQSVSNALIITSSITLTASCITDTYLYASRHYAEYSPMIWVSMLASLLVGVLTIVFATRYSRRGFDQRSLTLLVATGIVGLYPLLSLQEVMEKLLSPATAYIPDEYSPFFLLGIMSVLCSVVLIGLAVSAWQERNTDVKGWAWTLVAVQGLRAMLTCITSTPLEDDVAPTIFASTTSFMQDMAWIHFGLMIITLIRRGESLSKPHLPSGS